MSYLVICGVALLTSCLTFFSGFGLGTLLLPAFALFFPVEHAIAMTAVVHMLNGLFKLALVGRHTHAPTLLRFGLPAIAAALFGAWVLQWLTGLPPVYRYVAFGHAWVVTPVKLVVGILLLAFALVELLPRLRRCRWSVSSPAPRQSHRSPPSPRSSPEAVASSCGALAANARA